MRGPLTLRSLVLSGRLSRVPSAPRSLRDLLGARPARPPAQPPRCGHPAPGRLVGLGGSRRALRAAPRGWRRREHSVLHGRSDRPALLQRAEGRGSPPPLATPLRLRAPTPAVGRPPGPLPPRRRDFRPARLPAGSGRQEACPSRRAVRAHERLRGRRGRRAGLSMAFRQALQLAACGLAGGSAAVLFSAVAVGKPRAGGDAEPRVVEPPAWAGAARPGPGVWDPNWDRCGAGGWRWGAPGRPDGGGPPGPLPMRSVPHGAGARAAGSRVLPRRAATLPVRAPTPSSVPDGSLEEGVQGRPDRGQMDRSGLFQF